MKVLHLITGLARGGAENMLYKLLSGMARERFQHLVVSMTPGGVYAEKITALGVPVYNLGMKAGVPTPWAFLKLQRLVRQSNPDIIHGWMYHAGLLAMLSARDHPVILGIRSALSDIDREKFMTRQVITGLGHLSGGAASICYNSKLSQQQHEAAGYAGKHGVVIANGFDCNLFQPVFAKRPMLRAALGLASDAFIIGHLGRHHQVKDHDSLLAAFSYLSGDYSNVHLVMAGKGVCEDNNALNDFVKKKGLQGRVHLLGERDDIPELINGFDILVNASRSEAFPNVLGEAMASALPCVATDVGDSAFIIGDTGIIVPTRDPEALADALLQMINLDPAVRLDMGERARARIIEKFSLDRIAKDYAVLYEMVLMERRATLS